MEMNPAARIPPPKMGTLKRSSFVIIRTLDSMAWESVFARRDLEIDPRMLDDLLRPGLEPGVADLFIDPAKRGVHDGREGNG